MQPLPTTRTPAHEVPTPGHDGLPQARRRTPSQPGLVTAEALQTSVPVLLLSLPPLLPLLSPLHALLSPPEQQRAASLPSGLRRHQFLVGRSVLRLTLAGLLRCTPQAVPLTCTPQGKPILLQPPAPLHFSVTHSGSLLGLAFTCRAAIGFDLEHVDPLADVPALARTAWGPIAEAEFTAIPAGPHRQHAFFRRWVRFEAAGKQSGQGIFGGTPHAGSALPPRNLTYSDLTLPFNETVFAGAVACPLPLPVDAAWCEPEDVEALLGRKVSIHASAAPAVWKVLRHDS